MSVPAHQNPSPFLLWLSSFCSKKREFLHSFISMIFFSLPVTLDLSTDLSACSLAAACFMYNNAGYESNTLVIIVEERACQHR